MQTINSVTGKVFTSVNTSAGKTERALCLLQEFVEKNQIPASRVAIFDLTNDPSKIKTNTPSADISDLTDFPVIVKGSLVDVYNEIAAQKPLGIVINNLQSQCNRSGGARTHEESLLRNLSAIFKTMGEQQNGQKAVVFATARIDDSRHLGGNDECYNHELQKLISVFPNVERLGDDQSPNLFDRDDSGNMKPVMRAG